MTTYLPGVPGPVTRPFSVPAAVGWKVVQSAKKAATATGATSGSATFGTNLSSGTKIIAAVSAAVGSATTVTGVSDGHGNNLTLIGRKTLSSLLDVSLWAMDTPSGDVGAKPSITATLGASTGQISIVIQEVSGLLPGDTTAMADGTLGSNSGTGGSTTGSASYSSTAGNEYLVAVYGDDGGPETWTKPSALTADANSINGNSYADCAISYGNSTGGTEAGSWALTGTSADWATLLAAFKTGSSSTISASDAGTGTDAATVAIGGHGYDTGSGTDAAAVTAQSTAPPVFAASYSPAGSTSLAVTAAQSGTGTSDGLALTVKVVTGASGSPIGATAESSAVTTPDLSITPSGTGSWVYGALVNGAATTTFTAAANTTLTQNQYWSADEITFATFRSSGTTTASTPVTLGATAPTGTAGQFAVAMLEIKTSGTLAEDASSPAVASTTTATTVSTASFAPPPGALLVAMVSSDCSAIANQSMTIGLSDSSGLTWTRQVTGALTVGTGTFQTATVWTAIAPSSSGGDWTTNASPKAQAVTAASGNVIVLLGGSQASATTLGQPSGGPSSWTAGPAVDVTGFCAGYAWSSAVPGLSQGGGGGGTGGGGSGGNVVAIPLVVTTAVLPTAQVSQVYSTTLTATGGTGAGYTWAVSGGSLPAGLTLTPSTGTISGSPTGSASTATITVEVTDSGSNSATGSLAMTVITGPVGNPSGPWTLAFADEFNYAYPTPWGTGPNPNVWSDHFQQGDLGRTNNTDETEWYPHGYYGHSVAGSVLTLTATHQNPQSFDPTCPDPLQSGGPAGQFTSAMAAGYLGGTAFTYGYIEFYAQRPTIPTGAWGADWMLSRLVTWPPEIDVNEWDSPGHSGQEDQAYYNHSDTWQTNYTSDDTGSYHAYGCHVTSSTVTWYRDGTETFSATYDGDAVPWYPIMDYAIYATSGSGFPATHQIDYVRVWVPTGVPAQPVITSISPSSGIASGGDITVNFSAVSGATSYRVAASATDSLADNFPNPSGTLYTATGSSSPLTITGLPSGVRFNVTCCAINGSGYSMESVPAGPQIVNIQMVTAVLPNATVGAAYSATLEAQAGNPPYTWTISGGSLPAGLSLAASTGVISGTPTAAGASDFTAKVSGATNWTGGTTVANSATAALAITTTGGGGGGGGSTSTLTITTTSLPAATVSTTYSTALAATGGTGTGYTWTISGGSLPSWATLTASTGVIQGDPSAAGTSNFTVKVTDSGANTATQALSITASASTAAQPVGPGGSWNLVFEDDFPGTSLNTANWTALQGASINQVTTQASAVSVSGGYLRVGYTGAVNSNPASGYAGPSTGPAVVLGNCIEAKINFPNGNNWSAWWSDGGNWPNNGEEDIAEVLGGNLTAFNYHCSTCGPAPGYGNNGPTPGGTWFGGFHTYTLVRGETELQVWWDGVLQRTVTRTDSGGAQAMIINQGTGSSGNTILVEYVRMWTPG